MILRFSQRRAGSKVQRLTHNYQPLEKIIIVHIQNLMFYLLISVPVRAVTRSLVNFDEGPLVIFDPGDAWAAGSYGGVAVAAVLFGGMNCMRILARIICV
jgi:hypothetical protein